MARKATEQAAQPQPSLRLEWLSPAELAENPRNWRTHGAGQVQALTDVLSEVGWAGACLYNERTGRLIDGHARRKVALEQGSEKVPVLVGCVRVDRPAKHKYYLPLDDDMRQRIAPLARPYPKRVGSADSGTPAHQAGGGGANPTPALSQKAHGA